MNPLFNEYLDVNKYKKEIIDMISETEKSTGIPVYKFKHADVLNLIEHCNFHKLNDVQMFIADLNAYCEAYEKDILQDDIRKRFVYSSDEIKNCVKQVVKVRRRLLSPDEINVILNGLERYTHKFIVLGLYEGIGSYGEHLSDLLDTDATGINAETNEITLASGHTFKYSKRLIEYAIRSSQESIMYDTKGKAYETDTLGKIVRFKKMSNINRDINNNYNRITRWLYLYKGRNGFDQLSIPGLTSSGLINSIVDRIGTDKYTPNRRSEIEDILVKYNATDSTDTAIYKLVNVYRRVV